MADELTPDAPLTPPADASPAAAASSASTSAGANTLLLLVAWLAVFASAMSFTLAHPFDRHHDFNSAMFAIEGRVLVDYGFLQMRGGSYLSAGDIPRERRDFYVGHPPLVTWLTAGWMKIFHAGEFTSDRAMRSLPLAITLVNLLLLYFLVRNTLGPLAGLASAVFCSMFPMTAYFSQIVNFEPFVMTCMLASALAYARWLRTRSAGMLILLLVFLALGCWTDWPVYIFAGVLAIVHVSAERKPWQWKFGLGIIAVPILVFALFCLWIHVNGGQLLGVVHRFQFRTGLHGVVPDSMQAKLPVPGFGDLYKRIKSPAALNDWFLKWLTIPALALALIGVVSWRQISRDLATTPTARTAILRVLLVFVLTQILYTVAFPGGSAIHEYWQYYLIVPVAIFAGGLCVWLTIRGGERRSLLAGVSDRLAWASAALIPLLAIGPMIYYLGYKTSSPGNSSRIADARLLRQATRPDDVIFTNNNKIGFALAWYSDRMIDTEVLRLGTIENIKTQIDRYPGMRVIFLWDDAGFDDVKSALIANYGMNAYRFGTLEFFLLKGTPDPNWDPTRPSPPTASTLPGELYSPSTASAYRP